MKYIFPRYPAGKFKAVTLSYDDGCRQDIRLADILRKYGIKCTFNINTCRFDDLKTDSHLSAEEIKKYLLTGENEIAVHGDYHKAPGLCPPTVYIKDIIDCRARLEKEFDMLIRGMAYPDSGINIMQEGNSYEEIKHNIKMLGIAYARTIDKDNDSFFLPNDFYNWAPTCHHTNPEAIAFAEKFANMQLGKYCSGRKARLFYLWGHSYEFDRDDNWDLIEKLCEILGGREDIWYAANIEICDYIKAYQSLEFSLDQKIVYNPTAYKIWFEADGMPYSIESKETIHI